MAKEPDHPANSTLLQTTITALQTIITALKLTVLAINCLVFGDQEN